MANLDPSLTPGECDRLEDALERWTDAAFEPGPEDSPLPPHLRARLDDYHAVLMHARATLPIEEVRDDLLVAVLAEARRTASKPRREADRPGLWERLRRSLLVPGLALTGSAGLLLWLVQPDQELSLSASSSADAPAAREQTRLAPEPGPAAPGPVEAAGSLAAPRPAPENDAVTVSPPGPKAADMRPERPKKQAREGEAPNDGVEPGLGDSPKHRADKEDLRDTLDRADQAYQRGDCNSAMATYLAAMGMAGAPSEEARSTAGYGLCLRRQGDAAKADKYLSEARRLWPGIDAWISNMGVEGKQPGSKSPPPPQK